MAEFFFFTEPSKLSDQTASQAFSAIDQDQFRVGNMFSITEDARAFAITDGLVLVQQIGTTGLYNIILKPSEQPDLNLPKISYIIYKGINATSIIDGNKVAASTNNDLTRVIHDNIVQWYAAEGTAIPSTEPAANTSLGLEYTATNPDPDFVLQDGDRLDQVFYSSDAITLPFVFGGNYIGDFDSSGEIGLTIIFEKIGFHPTFELARSLTDILSFTPLGGTPTNAEVFRRKHENETVHNFMDAAAFFGAFTNSRLKVFDGSGFVNKSGDVLYNDVISKHFNKNTIYIDIRNESEDSFNYYENYANTLQWSLDGTDTLTNVDYYRNNGWPLLVIDDSVGSSEFDAGNLDRIIKLSFPRGDNESPLIYYRRAYKADLGTQLPTGPEQFYSPAVISDAFACEDLIPYLVSNRASADYFQIKIIRRVILENDENNDFPRQGYSLFKRSYLDNLFPIFDMDIPFTNTNYTNLKVYYDAAFIDKVLVDSGTLNDGLSEYALRDFVSSTGVASDTNNISFIAFPFKYHINQDNNDDFLPISGFETTGANPFLIELDNLISQVNLVRSSFLIGGSSQEYLNFVNNTIANGAQSNNQYSFDDVIVLSVTRAEYQALEQLKQQHFVGPYKVYLGVKNISVLTDDDGNRYSYFTYVLRGLTENNGEIETHEELTTITSITSDAILGINSGHIFPIDNPFIEEDYGERNGAHRGIDIEASTDAGTPGQPIYAVWTGEIVRIIKSADLVENGGTDDDAGGVRIRILGNNGVHYNYFHMQPGSNDSFNMGDTVQQGTQIGSIGLSGEGFNVNPDWEQFHLHFETWSSVSPVIKVSPYSIFPELALLPYERHRD
jgi:murein DD-endopeptidase MepM/ murein hydrolase activator NlpD